MAIGSALRGASAATTASVSSWALAPYASHHARWKAHAENGVAHGVVAARRSHVSRGISSNGRRSARRAPGARSVVSGKASTGPGQAGSASRAGAVIAARIASSPLRWLRPQPGPLGHLRARRHRYPERRRTAPWGSHADPSTAEDSAVPDGDQPPVRRAAAHPLDPGQRHLRRLLPELPADGELPRDRGRHPVGPRPEAHPDLAVRAVDARARRARHPVPGDDPAG